MNRLLRFREVFPKFRFCGNFLNESKCQESRILLVRTCVSRISDRGLAKLKAQDMIPEDFNLVYKGDMENYMYGASLTSWIGLIFGASVVFKIVFQDEPVSFPVMTFVPTLKGLENYTELGIMYCALLGTLTILQLLSSRYILRMYYNPKTNTYRAIRLGMLPMSPKPHNFQAGTLKKKEKIHIIPWWNIQYNSNGTKILLSDDGFKSYADYERMFSK